VLGGGVAGSLVAATPIQVVVGSFIAETKKPKSVTTPSPSQPTNMLNFGSGSVPGASPPSADGGSSESSDQSGSSPLHRPPPGSGWLLVYLNLLYEDEAFIRINVDVMLFYFLS
nr:AT-hook motif nuclear-localized protein 8 [Tanacetum cinerariifolium]